MVLGEPCGHVEDTVAGRGWRGGPDPTWLLGARGRGTATSELVGNGGRRALTRPADWTLRCARFPRARVGTVRSGEQEGHPDSVLVRRRKERRSLLLDGGELGSGSPALLVSRQS